MNPAAPPVSHGRYTRFADFYPFYLTEHSNRVSRRRHFVGTALALLTFAVAAGDFVRVARSHARSHEAMTDA